MEKQVEEVVLKAGALQSAIFNSANFPSIATDATGVIQIFKGDREKCLDAGASDYIAKPVNTDQLLSLMRVWLFR
jgi:CheY-like chemotaxis protein